MTARCRSSLKSRHPASPTPLRLTFKRVRIGKELTDAMDSARHDDEYRSVAEFYDYVVPYRERPQPLWIEVSGRVAARCDSLWPTFPASSSSPSTACGRIST